MPSSSVLHKRASQRTPFFGFERDCNLASVVKEIYAHILSDTNISQKPCKVVAVDLGNVFQGRKPEQKFTGPRKHNVKKLLKMWPKMVGWACRSSLTMQFTQSKAVHSRGFLALSHDLITFNWIAIGCLVFQFHSKQHKLQIKHGKWWSQNAIGLKVSATLVAISFGQEICKRFPFNGIQEVLKRIEEKKMSQHIQRKISRKMTQKCARFDKKQTDRGMAREFGTRRAGHPHPGRWPLYCMPRRHGYGRRSWGEGSFGSSWSGSLNFRT